VLLWPHVITAVGIESAESFGSPVITLGRNKAAARRRQEEERRFLRRAG
jgi:hypothetical protein